MPGTARPYLRRVAADREWATRRNRAVAAHAADLARREAGEAARAAEFDTGPNPLLQRDCELRRLSRVQSIYGGTTEIMKEIIGRSLGLWR
jgi:alkylation response protein AidB-like acyl-CoA dehydrogenase